MTCEVYTIQPKGPVVEEAQFSYAEAMSMNGVVINRNTVPVNIHWRFIDPSGMARLNGVYHASEGVLIDEQGELDPFWWTEGNGSCDCNRAICFLGWHGFPCSWDHFHIEKIART